MVEERWVAIRIFTWLRIFNVFYKVDWIVTINKLFI